MTGRSDDRQVVDPVGCERHRRVQRLLQGGGLPRLHLRLERNLRHADGRVVAAGQGQVHHPARPEQLLGSAESLIRQRLFPQQRQNESGDGLLVRGEAGRGLSRAYRLDRLRAHAGPGGESRVGGPLDVAAPFTGRENDGELLQVLRYGALKTQLRAHRGQVACRLRAVQHGAKLQAEPLGRVAVVADPVVDLLSFGVQVLAIHVRHRGPGRRRTGDLRPDTPRPQSPTVGLPVPRPDDSPKAAGHLTSMGANCVSERDTGKPEGVRHHHGRPRVEQRHRVDRARRLAAEAGVSATSIETIRTGKTPAGAHRGRAESSPRFVHPLLRREDALR